MIRFLLIAALAATPLMAQLKKWTDEEVMKVHRSAILIDGHNDVTSDTLRGLDLGPRRKDGHTDIPRMKEGGMGAQFFAAYVSASYASKNASAHRALEMIDTIRRDIVEKHPGDFLLAVNADDVLAARRQNKMAALIGVEGGHAIEDDLRLLRAYYNLGARYMTLTHANTNGWADSSGDMSEKEVKHHDGLTDFGRQVIAEMNRLGMMVDIAHVSDKTFEDVLKVSKAPVFSSHSSCRALSNIPRNMTDEMIHAVAKTGGLVMINFGCEFLSQKSADTSTWTSPKLAKIAEERLAGAKDPAARRAVSQQLRKEFPMTRATIDDVVAHIDHIKKIAGVEYVGLGSDFDGVSCTPEGLDDVSKWPNLTRKLLERGYTPEEIRKVYGENLLRFMRAVEGVAAGVKTR